MVCVVELCLTLLLLLFVCALVVVFGEWIVFCCCVSVICVVSMCALVSSMSECFVVCVCSHVFCVCYMWDCCLNSLCIGLCVGVRWNCLYC